MAGRLIELNKRGGTSEFIVSDDLQFRGNFLRGCDVAATGSRGVFLILKGTARAALRDEPGRELACHIAGPGSVMGLSSALCATRYQFDVEALETVEAIYLGTDAVNEILRQHSEICMRVMNMMCDELTSLRQTREHMQSCEKHSCSLHRSCTHAANLQ
jgi:CRP-like cAMP-binding protein